MNAGTVRNVCISEKKGTPKTGVSRAELRVNHGIEDDAHAGPGHRQVSLLAETDIKFMRSKGLELEPGAFGENLVVDGLDLNALGVGTLLRVGEAELEITQIGKVCHSRCAIFYSAGDCIMPRAGLFARVVKGGSVKAGLPINVLTEVPRETVQAAVLTVSDRCAAGGAPDTSGPAVVALLEQKIKAHIAWTGTVPDEIKVISKTLKDLADRNLDLIVTTGGTGCAPRDVTPEATRAMIEREVPGLGEAMRAASAQSTPHAWLQRGVCGLRASTLIINLPGSRKGAEENLNSILPALPHAIQQARGHTAHPDTDTRG